MTALTLGLIGAASFAAVVLAAYCCWCVSVRRRVAQDSTVEAAEVYRAEADDDWWRGR